MRSTGVQCLVQNEFNLLLLQWSANGYVHTLTHSINCWRLFTVSVCANDYCFACYLTGTFKFSRKRWITHTYTHSGSGNICVWNVYLIFIVIMNEWTQRLPVASRHWSFSLRKQFISIVGVGFISFRTIRSTTSESTKGFSGACFHIFFLVYGYSFYRLMRCVHLGVTLDVWIQSNALAHRTIKFYFLFHSFVCSAQRQQLCFENGFFRIGRNFVCDFSMMTCLWTNWADTAKNSGFSSDYDI